VSDWKALERFLRTDPLDAGCAETFDLLDRYVEREIAYRDAAARFPEVAAHLSGCNPCVQDFEGLLSMIAAGRGPVRHENI